MQRLHFTFLVFLALLGIITAIRESDKVNSPPGMANVTIYSGLLNTLDQNRKLHYVFVEAQQNPQEAPLTWWLNGGPGCSSLIGFMQEVGPYLVGNSYVQGDNLTKNPYRWNKISNMLFIQSPGIVGFSSDTNEAFPYTDMQTADDAFMALQNFLGAVAPQFSNRQLFIAGESYAGKYIPDVAVRILQHNRQQNATYINLKGVLIGNGVMNFEGQSLTRSSIEYMIQHDFLSERLSEVYQSACEIDFQSPRCKYFRYEFSLLRKDLNHYNVYEVCQLGQSVQSIRLQQVLRQVTVGSDNPKQTANKEISQQKINLKQILDCPSDQGMIDYLNKNKAAYNLPDSRKTWSPCADLSYSITQSGSLQQYAELFLNKAVKIWLFNGDWDDVVPYNDTEKNLEKLRRKKTGEWEPWFKGQKHAGFYQVYDSVTVITVKGASHMVPQTKPAEAYQMFFNFIHDRPINTPV